MPHNRVKAGAATTEKSTWWQQLWHWPEACSRSHMLQSGVGALADVAAAATAATVSLSASLDLLLLQ